MKLIIPALVLALAVLIYLVLNPAGKRPVQPEMGPETPSSQTEPVTPVKSVQEYALIQRLYDRYFPDPLIVTQGVPVRLYITTIAREHVNKISIKPFVSETDLVLPGRITLVKFTPQEAGEFEIFNLGHGFTGKLIVAESEAAAQQLRAAQAVQEVALIHSLPDTQTFPNTIVVQVGPAVQIANTALREQHWVSLAPWVEAPASTEPGNVKPKEITLFEFTPEQSGEFDIYHTVHGFAGKLIVAD